MNPNHDPSNGQFTFGSGGGVASRDQDAAKAKEISTSADIAGMPAAIPNQGGSNNESRGHSFEQNLEKIRKVRTLIPPQMNVTTVEPKRISKKDGPIPVKSDMDRLKEVVSAVNKGLNLDDFSSYTKQWLSDGEGLSSNASNINQQCVAAVKYLIGNNSPTGNWAPLNKLDDDNLRTIEMGTAIATFTKDNIYGTYHEGQHTAIVIGYGFKNVGGKQVSGLWVIDQYAPKVEKNDGRIGYRFLSLDLLKKRNYHTMEVRQGYSEEKNKKK